MIHAPVARRYARALFDAAAAREVLVGVGEDLQAVVAFLENNAHARQLITAPQIATVERQGVARRLFGEWVHPLVRELLSLLLEKRRFALLADVAHEYRARLEDHRGQVRIAVTSAVPLPEDLERRLVAALATHTGREVILEQQVVPELLGGLRVQIGDRVIERSVQGSLRELRAALAAVALPE